MENSILPGDDEIFLQELAAIGVDTNIGLRYNGDLHIYKEVLQVSAKASLEKLENIRKSFECKDFNKYTILVHSIKSSAANIGAIEVSVMAKKLENAGINKDYGYIDNNHMEFIERFEHLIYNLADIIELKNDVQVIEEPIKKISQEDWDLAINKLNIYLTELELDEAEELAKSLMIYSFSIEAKEIIEKMINCLQRFDVEGAKENLIQLKGLKALL